MVEGWGQAAGETAKWEHDWLKSSEREAFRSELGLLAPPWWKPGFFVPFCSDHGFC